MFGMPHRDVFVVGTMEDDIEKMVKQSLCENSRQPRNR